MLFLHKNGTQLNKSGKKYFFYLFSMKNASILHIGVRQNYANLWDQQFISNEN